MRLHKESVKQGRGLHILPALTLMVMLGPVVAGLFGTLLPAFGLMPSLSLQMPTLQPFHDLIAWPGLFRAVRLMLTTGLLATLISLASAIFILSCWQGTALFRIILRCLAPLLSVPHAAAAFGIAFLIAPSGWLARIVSPELTGWDRPPDLLIVQDPLGFAMIAGLVAKETPFLLLMAIAALSQADADKSLTIARSLGYRREIGWLKAIFPRIYAQIRLPVYVVLAYSMSVVDVALILGPNTPPTLAVQIVRWFNDPEIAFRMRAAAAALLQFSLVLGTLSLWYLGEIAASALGRYWVERGARRETIPLLQPLSLFAASTIAIAVFLGLVGLMIWSFAGFWAFPDSLPETLSLRNWSRHAHSIGELTAETYIIATTATIGALILTIGCLEAEYRFGTRLSSRSLWLLYLPLLIPQVAFLPGLQILMLSVGLTHGRYAVIFAHMVFVLPYVFLSLGDPFRAWERRYGTVGLALGSHPNGVLWRIRIPMLLTPILTAAAVGFSVSVGQYLPTLLIGGGSVATLTTETVALSSGGDRRAIGVYAIAQTIAALMPFTLALILPRFVWYHRQGLRHS